MNGRALTPDQAISVPLQSLRRALGQSLRSEQDDGSPRANRRMSLTDTQVTAIRSAGLTDTEWARRLKISVGTIRGARIGLTYRHVATPPDVAPRDGNGRGQKPVAKPARVRRSYLNESLSASKRASQSSRLVLGTAAGRQTYPRWRHE